MVRLAHHKSLCYSPRRSIAGYSQELSPEGTYLMQPELIFDLAHLGHMELLTPKPEESLQFSST